MAGFDSISPAITTGRFSGATSVFHGAGQQKHSNVFSIEQDSVEYSGQETDGNHQFHVHTNLRVDSLPTEDTISTIKELSLKSKTIDAMGVSDQGTPEPSLPRPLIHALRIQRNVESWRWSQACRFEFFEDAVSKFGRPRARRASSQAA
jgi:hypothetical protein